MGIDLNPDGQRHADWYVALPDEVVPLRDALGRPTWHFLARSQLRYTDAAKASAARGWSGKKDGFSAIDGLARLDYHERFGPVKIETGAKVLLVFHRGGMGYLDTVPGNPPGSAVKYGYLALSDIDDSAYELPQPFSSGANRGAMVTDATDYRTGLYAVRPKPTQGFLYKGLLPDGSVPWGSLWWTYTDMGAIWGGDVHYVALCWSFLNAGGGGMVRAVLPDGTRIRQCQVPRETCGIWDINGTQIGDMRGQYVRTSNRCYGWMPWCFRTIYTGGTWTYLAEQVG